jgi:uncharacterized sporulation protein YeaH/YhbH (DUF444 family)
MSNEDKIDSGESEGMYNEFVSDRIEDKVEDIVTNGFDSDGSEIIVELGDIEAPTFEYGNSGNGGGGGKGSNPSRDSDGLKFGIPFDRFMQAIAKRFRLPFLNKEGNGKIRETSLEWKTYGPVGTILDKRRTFKRALKTNVATGDFDPENGKFDILIKRKDKRFKLPETIEKPKYKAVVMFIGDVSYSTYGKRLEQEKKYVSFIQSWINFNYGKENVDYRFFVHEGKSYEVGESQFYNVANSGGTQASPAFKLAIDVATTDYDPQSTNIYVFYFGDGELFKDDAEEISELLQENAKYFSRIGVVEVLPKFACLYDILNANLPNGRGHKIALAKHEEARDIIDNIKTLFR